MNRFNPNEKRQFIADMHSAMSEGSYEEVEVLADNLEEMYSQFPQLWDEDKEGDGWVVSVPNEDFETWFYQQEEAWKTDAGLSGLFDKYNSLCRARGGTGY